jgi:hypothetical protein
VTHPVVELSADQEKEISICQQISPSRSGSNDSYECLESPQDAAPIPDGNHGGDLLLSRKLGQRSFPSRIVETATGYE